MSSPPMTSLQPSVDANFPIFSCAVGSLGAALDTCSLGLDEIPGRRAVGGTAEAQFPRRRRGSAAGFICPS
jgi:hypothetical protein